MSDYRASWPSCFSSYQYQLMPFRLTRQIRNLMLPLDVKGFIENTIIHILQALRSDSDLLLNTLDIFVKEPSLDWKVCISETFSWFWCIMSRRLLRHASNFSCYFFFCFDPFPHIDVFWRLCSRWLFENMATKEEISPFVTVFSTLFNYCSII